MGAFGEFSESISLLIEGEGLAHECALKNPVEFGQSNNQAAFGAIHSCLKRWWARLAVTTAAESHYTDLGQIGGATQQQAAAAHAQAQAQGDWRDDGSYRQWEAEITAPLFLGSSGGAKPSFLSCYVSPF